MVIAASHVSKWYGQVSGLNDVTVEVPAGIILFTQAVQQALVRTTGSRSWALISPGETLDVIGDTVFRINTTSTVPTVAAIAVVVALVVASVVVLERRVRGVEVVT